MPMPHFPVRLPLLQLRPRRLESLAMLLIGALFPALMLAGVGLRAGLAVPIVLVYAWLFLGFQRLVERRSGERRSIAALIAPQLLFLLPIITPLGVRVAPMVPWRTVLAVIPFVVTALVQIQVLIVSRAVRDAEPSSGPVGERRAGGVLLALVFLVITFVELWGHLIPPLADTLLEQRALATLPPFDRHAVLTHAYFAGLDAWCDDHFRFRNQLIVMNSLIQYRLMHKSILPDLVITGHRPWLFYGGDSVLADIQRWQPLSPVQLDDIHAHVADLAAWCRHQGIDLVLVMPPNKESIYTDQLPGYLHAQLASPSHADQILGRLALDPEITTLDLRPVLARARSWQRLYSYSDTHWNDCGAYVADIALLDLLRTRLSLAVRVPSLEGVQTSWSTQDGGDLAHMLGLGGLLHATSEVDSPWRVISEDQPAFTPAPPRTAVQLVASPIAARRPGLVITQFTTPDARLPSAYVIHDSFMEALGPFLRESFRQTTFLWKEPADLDLDPQELKALHPSVLIIEIVERDWTIFLKPILPSADVPR